VLAETVADTDGQTLGILKYKIYLFIYYISRTHSTHKNKN